MDVCVRQLLPREEWKSLRWTQLLGDQDNEDAEGDEADSTGTEGVDVVIPRAEAAREGADGRVVPTGRVKGILQRRLTEVAATVPFKQSASLAQRKPDAKSGESASFAVSNRDEYVLCIPLDRRLPRVRIVTRQWEKLQGQRVIVSVNEWPQHSRYPNGHFIRSLGPSGEWKTELEALMLKHSVHPRPFSTEAMACLPLLEPRTPQLSAQSHSTDVLRGESAWMDSHWVPPSVEGRRDLRQIRRVFSVDPPGCQDIDDAMSVYWLVDGVVEVGVHIADVCAFLEQGSALDAEAQARSTTVYLTHARIDMLPSLLSSDIASLQGERDRYAVSVFFRVKVTHLADGSPVRPSDMTTLDESNIVFTCPTLPDWAGRTVIHSVAAMTYDQAHNLLQGDPPDAVNATPVPAGQAGRPVKQSLWDPLRGDLTVLTAFARHLLRAREMGGAVDLNVTEGGQLKFQLDKDGFPVQVDGGHSKEIHNTIAEIMIYANSAVARLIHSEMPSASLLRIHPPPSLEMMKELQKLTEGLGLQGLFEGVADEDIQRSARDFKMRLRRDKQCDEGVVNFITSAVIRCMTAARYHCSEAPIEGGGQEVTQHKHYGLGLTIYTHFTSPIRRYADVIVHRQLLAVLHAQKGSRTDSPVLRSESVSKSAAPAPVVLPASRAISIVDDSTWNSSTAQLCRDGKDVKVKRTADGRIQVEKVTTLVEVLSTRPVDTSHGQAVHAVDLSHGCEGMSEGDDLDLLDSLLGDVGGSLMDTVSRGGLSATVPAICPPEQPGVEAGGEGDYTDELDLLLSDVCAADGLIATAPIIKATATSQPGGGSGVMVEMSGHADPPAALHEEPLSVPLPYSSAQLTRVTDHLNAMNKRAKAAQVECQELYVRHYFTRKQEVHWAVVFELKQNGFLAFVPAFDHKGPVYLTGRDNSTVQCVPGLLGREKETSQEPSEGNCRFASSSSQLREFPDLKCVLLSGRPADADELVVCPKGADAAGCEGGRGVLRIRCLQRVQVLMSCTHSSGESRTLGIPMLCLQLVGVGESGRVTIPGGRDKIGNSISKSDMGGSRLRNDNRKDSLKSWKKGAGGTQQRPLGGGAGGVLSLYRALADCLRERSKSLPSDLLNESESEQLRILAARNTKRIEKITKAVKGRRHVLHGTGRLAYGLDTDIPPLFLTRAGGDSGVADSTQGGTTKLLYGKEAAMQQMKAWGEEWAEEEDLPGGSGQGYAEEGGVESGAPIDISKYNIGRETAIATQRIHKLKTAKRNSKY